jgi:osmotically-inducible protein OsmY
MKTKERIQKYLTYSIALVWLLLAALTTRAADEDPTDKDITRAIETELLAQRGVYSNLVDVKTTDGVVTLTGSVRNILEKERSARVAKSLRGVVGVINKLEINAPDIDDATLKENVEQALRKDPAADSYQITTRVNDGTVTLTGTVESWQEKQLAAKVAKGVNGVTALNNEINFEFTQRSDTEIKKDIQEQLEWDIYVSDALIDVAVQNGKVTLTGSVGNALAKDRAEFIGYVSGVASVDVDNLKVEQWLDEEAKRNTPLVAKGDEQIRKAVEKVFLYDPRVLSFNPEIEVNNGIVTLSGAVGNLMARQAAEADARNVVGVIRVKNLMKVRLPEPIADTVVTRNARWVLRMNPYVEKYQVDVNVINGIAYLSGDVDSRFEKMQAEESVSKAEGVLAVVNNLKLLKDQAANASVYRIPYYPYTSRKPDSEIKDDISSQLWWSPFVNRDEVTVLVNNGHVVLTGTVDSWNERAAAEENAFEGGAITVSNQLEIGE